MRTPYIKLGLVFVVILNPILSFCQIEFDHQQDNVYGYKDGMALVMDVYSPVDRGIRAGIILVISSGMVSIPL